MEAAIAALGSDYRREAVIPVLSAPATCVLLSRRQRYGQEQLVPPSSQPGGAPALPERCLVRLSLPGRVLRQCYREQLRAS